MCAESVDLPAGRHVDVLRVDPSVPPRDEDGSVVVAARLVEPSEEPWPYGDDRRIDSEDASQDIDRTGPDAVPQLGQPRAVDDARVDPGHDHVERMSAR